MFAHKGMVSCCSIPILCADIKSSNLINKAEGMISSKPFIIPTIIFFISWRASLYCLRSGKTCSNKYCKTKTEKIMMLCHCFSARCADDKSLSIILFCCKAYKKLLTNECIKSPYRLVSVILPGSATHLYSQPWFVSVK